MAHSLGYQFQARSYKDGNALGQSQAQAIIYNRYPKLLRTLSQSLTIFVVDEVVFKEIQEWKDRDYIYLSALADTIKLKVRDTLKESPGKASPAEEIVETCVKDWIKSIAHELDNAIKPILEKNTSNNNARKNLAFSKTNVTFIRVVNVYYKLDIERLVEILYSSEIVGAIVVIIVPVIGAILDVLVDYIVALVLIYILATFIAATGAGLSIALPLYARAVTLASQVAESEINVVRELGGGIGEFLAGDIRGQNYATCMRHQFYNKIIDKKSALKSDIDKKIIEALANNHQLKSQVTMTCMLACCMLSKKTHQKTMEAIAP
ncbi:hypothetical protein BJP36_06600 [Moorena producens JHB]|uniref:Uncharacterized protein n=1 Tax=Moorena producens (strain JHB) TaxID=1454205 RepID=A0A1D9FW91_MOOP1|nr:hypothetical protein [Moorena producens]AOY79642.1 hypothetical protein BJP36_06600 [Moorena producens JHB]